VSKLPLFAELAAGQDATLDVVALALAAEFRDVDAAAALATLDRLADELLSAAEQTSGTPDALARACGQTLGVAQGFAGDQAHYDDPDNSMLDLVLTRRRGLPILLSVVYVEVARRAGIELSAVGLPGHFVVGHFGIDPPLLLDPFAGGGSLSTGFPLELVRPWRAPEIAMRMLNNLVAAYRRRGNLSAAMHAATMRIALPAREPERDILQAELRAMQAQLN
jgi:regulator of sirC expression with transglutaminase-like and TPR domain